jgi:outer membrane cobalamin receptor
MKSRSKVSIVLYSMAVGVGCCMAVPVMAEEPAVKPEAAVQKADAAVQTPDAAVQKPEAAVQKADGTAAQADGAAKKVETAKSSAIPPTQRQAELMPSTGSNIRRFRAPDTTLPHVELDRAYIDQSGATNAAELLRTVPQVQVPAK